MAVTGTIDPKRVVRNAGARPGDILLLTKPLGTGVLSTALKRGEISEDRMQDAVAWMTLLNDRAASAMLAAHAHAATDITGYGLLGHAGEMMRASGVALHVHSSSVPLMPGVIDLIAAGAVPGGTRDNAIAHALFTSFAAAVPAELRLALSDAQTSGGLLVALDPGYLTAFQEHVAGSRALCAVIGEVRSGEGIFVD
jgi:selenide,water dikinase